MKMLRYFAFAFCLFCLCNISFSQSNDCLKKNLGQLYGINDSLLNVWRNDPYGCGQRRVSLIDSLFKNDLLAGVPKKAFFLMYGIPDEITAEGIYIYKNVKECDKLGKPKKETMSLDITVVFQNERFAYFREIYVD